MQSVENKKFRLAVKSLTVFSSGDNHGAKRHGEDRDELHDEGKENDNSEGFLSRGSLEKKVEA